MDQGVWHKSDGMGQDVQNETPEHEGNGDLNNKKLINASTVYTQWDKLTRDKKNVTEPF